MEKQGATLQKAALDYKRGICEPAQVTEKRAGVWVDHC